MHSNIVYSYGTLAQAAQYLENLNLDFLIDTGDITNNAAVQEFADYNTAMSVITCPMYQIPGNHDDEGGGTFTNFDAAGLSRHFTIDAGKFRLIGITSTGDPDASVSADEIAYADAAIAAAGGRSVILITHHPFTNIAMVAGYADMENYLTTKGITRQWAGHIHLGCVEYLVSGIQMVCGGSLYRNGINPTYNDYGGIMICTVYSDRIEIDYRSGRSPFQSWTAADYPAYTKVTVTA